MKISMLLSEEEYNPTIFETYKNWYWQEKINGIRAIIHIKDNKITAIRNRNDMPVLHLFPELKEITLPVIEGIFDGEIAMTDEKGKSIFYGGIDRRRSIKSEAEIKQMPYKLKLFLFDVLKFGKEITTHKPYKDRMRLLQEAGLNSEHTEVVKNWNGKELWDFVVKEDREGIVIKNPLSIYEIDTRSRNNIKVKNYKTADVMVEKTEENPKGLKIYGTAKINDRDIVAEVQFGGRKDIKAGDVVKVKYLDIYGNKLIQATKE